ncbi:Hypothetical predicted protein [Mytilus galloprovincialis]|uniref:Tyr recombinase domain-containing protein n=1 Tax=Mytilus galloprovincialis TaxID=29158 RepID=A0A8B6DJM1_MYTGA|nr:Hypothetical predicted protein [Mytilus galloprovincialis]
MAGVFNERAPLPRYTKTWDVDIVLKFISSMGSNKNLSLKELTLKLTMLLALTSASRSSDIQKLDMDYMNVRTNEIIFTMVKLTKTRKTGSQPYQITFLAPSRRMTIFNVVQCILDYIDKTVSLRPNECNQLIISFIKPHKPVKSCTIAHWLKRMLESAGIDTDIFKPHSTRGASTSKANKFGVSIKQIMNIANWRSRGTFEKFYHKPLETEIEAGSFQSTVLKL